MVAFQFLSTHFCTDLGEGHSPVNCPTSLRSAKEMVPLLGSIGGREIFGILSSFLTKLLTNVLFLGAPFSAIKDAKASTFSSFPIFVEE